MVIINRVFLLLFYLNVCAYSTELSKSFPQGSLVIGQNNEANEIFVDGEPIKISHDGYYVFPISREQIEPINVTYSNSDGIFLIHQISIEEQDYDIQRIDGLPEQMVTPLDDEIIKRIIAENEVIKEAKKLDMDLTYFKEEFIQPTTGIISGVFGSQRILNGKAKSPHRGIDIAADEGTPVMSCNEGIVIHAESDLYYTGGTIIIDHGHGVKSIYAHLSSVNVAVNQKVSKEDIIGKVGSTGRSTGPHLHWGVMVFNTYVDPLLLLEN